MRYREEVKYEETRQERYLPSIYQKYTILRIVSIFIERLLHCFKHFEEFHNTFKKRKMMDQNDIDITLLVLNLL